jgi:CIC family chloride channel protein
MKHPKPGASNGADKKTNDSAPATFKTPPAWLLRCRDLMERRILTVSPRTSAADLAAILDVEGVGGVPVVADGRLLGIVTKTDLTREVSTRHSLDTKAFEMMSPNVVTAGEDETAAELAARMLEQRIHRILVTSGGEVTGVITSFDLLRAVVEYESHLVEGSR